MKRGIISLALLLMVLQNSLIVWNLILKKRSLTVSKTSAGITIKSGTRSPGNRPSGQQPTSGGMDDSSQLPTDPENVTHATLLLEISKAKDTSNGLPPPVLVNVKRPAPPVPKNPKNRIFWDIDENKTTGPSSGTYRELKTFQTPTRRPISMDDVSSQPGNLLPRPPRTRPYTFVDPSTVEWPESSTTTQKVQKPEQGKKKSVRLNQFYCFQIFFQLVLQFWSRKDKKDKKVDIPKPKSEAEELEIVWMKKK
ncbi:hypothetical protein CAEBREN_17970 [Caenorhabditis brenneri]|uniref:Uncharacterized protein n=1 Tax=Caenorhabditis brenneri TaxID=135651 RepID=G0NIR0_CAEBE|nr:hypothetical protein CAEBREN_17970 [Caenorhabditis brenneri]